MATRTRRPAPKRRRTGSGARRTSGGAGSGSTKRRGARRPPSRPAARKRRRHSRVAPAVRGTVRALRWGGRAASRGLVATAHAPVEVWGALALLAGALAGAGIYGSGPGPAAGVADHLTSLLVGRVGALAPPLILVAGVLLIIPRTRAHVGRIVVGSLCCLLALAGLVHLALGNRPVSVPLVRLGKAGGIIGAVVARPLSSFIGTWPVWALLAALFGVGLLVVTRTPMSRVVQWTRTALWSAGAFIRALAQGSDDVRGDSDEELDADPSEAPNEAAGIEEDEEDPPAHTPRAPQQLAIAVGDTRSYKLPSLELLGRGDSRQVSAASVRETISVLEGTLEQFNVDAAVTGHTAGPTVTRFEIELGSGVKVNRVISLANEMKYALASGELRFLVPIPGRSAIGVEVPNRARQLVTLGDVLRSETAQGDKHPLTISLGKDISGETVLANLTEMPHLLIAGATNSGKSSCINSMITSVLARARPEQVRMILIDPKRVELSHFAGVPHLITPVVTVPKKAASALGWVVREMEMRYEALAHCGMRNLELYNEAAAQGTVIKRNDDDPDPEPLPYILVIVDELSDLMMVAPRDVESAICRIAQMARAVGIHLVVATQRPSVDVVTGLIKANIPSRLAFSVASQQDSRVILDQGGADKLIGHGDMLFLHANSSLPLRVQGSWVTEKEIAGIVGHCRRQGQPDYVPGVTAEEASGELGGGADGDDDLLEEALDLVVRSGLGSTSMLQRKLKVGFSRAGRLMDLLEQRGVVGPSQGSKPRDVLMTAEELGSARDGEREAG
ncbi:DNA translocase FtsK [soil metagenome]